MSSIEAPGADRPGTAGLPNAASLFAPLMIELRVNGSPARPAQALRGPGGALLVDRAVLAALRIRLPDTPGRTDAGTAYEDLSDLPGSRWEFDAQTQSVDLRLPYESLVPETVSAAEALPRLSESTLGATLGYDLVAQGGDGHGRASGLLDAAFSGSWGVLSHSTLVGGSADSVGTGRTRNVRLETAFRRDDPATLTRWTVGDAVTQSAAWSAPFRFGGVQWGTQFGLRPGYVSYPTPGFQAGAALPSTVELYVNDSLRYQRQVQPGAFAVDRLPVLTGAGEMRFRTVDAQGVAREVTAPYYVSSTLLRPGLSEHSLEAGWTRLRYGSRGADYGPPFVSGSWRHGWNERLTVDFHGEASTQVQVAGAGLTWVWPAAGEFALHGAASHGTGGARADADAVMRAAPRSGQLARASFARLGTDWSFSASAQAASAGFTQVGWEDSSLRVRRQQQIFLGRTLGRAGSLGASLTTLRYDRREPVRLLSLSYSLPVGGALVSLYAAMSDVRGQGRQTTTGIMLTVPLGGQRTASLSATREREGTAFSTDVSDPPPVDAGWGYRAGVTRGAVERSQAQVQWRSPATTLGFEAASTEGRSAARVTATGVVGFAGGRAFALQERSEALAIVSVPGVPGITVYRENQPVARTDADGTAIVPGLRPYDANQLLIDADELPIASHVRQGGLTVVPQLRGVALARFDITDSVRGSASLRIVMPDGRPIEPGSAVHRQSAADALTAGFGGLVWLDEPRDGERLRAAWRGGHCIIVVDAIPVDTILPDLGERRCTPER